MQHRHPAWRHGQTALTWACSTDTAMHHGHKHAARKRPIARKWTCSIDMDMRSRHRYICSTDMDMQHENGYAAQAWTCSVNRDMQHGHEYIAWTWTVRYITRKWTLILTWNDVDIDTNSDTSWTRTRKRTWTRTRTRTLTRTRTRRLSFMQGQSRMIFQMFLYLKEIFFLVAMVSLGHTWFSFAKFDIFIKSKFREMQNQKFCETKFFWPSYQQEKLYVHIFCDQSHWMGLQLDNFSAVMPQYSELQGDWLKSFWPQGSEFLHDLLPYRVH